MKNLPTMFLFLVFTSSVAQEKTFTREYTYRAGEMDSKISCRAIAVNQLRVSLLQEIGVYVESEQLLKTKEIGTAFSQDFVENITTVTAGVTKLEILEEKWNGETFWMRAAITIDEKVLKESLRELANDRRKVKELEKLRKELNETNENLKALKDELGKVKKENEKAALLEKYNNNIDNLNWTDFEYNLINLFYKGFNKYKAGDHNGAVQAFDQALNLNPEFAKLNFKSAQRKIDGVYEDIYNTRGAAKAQLQDNLGAMEDYNKAIEIDKDFSVAYFNRGLCKASLDDYEGAVADYNRAIQIDPNYVNAYIDRGIAKSSLGDHSGSIADQTTAIKIDPQNSRAFMQRGNAKGNLGKFKEAIEDYNKCLALESDNAMAYANRGIAFNLLNNSQAACLDWKRAVELGFNGVKELIMKHCK